MQIEIPTLYKKIFVHTQSNIIISDWKAMRLKIIHYKNDFKRNSILYYNIILHLISIDYSFT